VTNNEIWRHVLKWRRNLIDSSRSRGDDIFCCIAYCIEAAQNIKDSLLNLTFIMVFSVTEKSVTDFSLVYRSAFAQMFSWSNPMRESNTSKKFVGLSIHFYTYS
jgi:hypothetical protein